MNSTEAAVRIDAAKQTKRAERLQWYRDESMRRAKKLLDLFEELRNDPLEPWRAQYDSFEACCEAEFGTSASRIRQLRNAASLKKILALEAPDIATVIEKMPEGQLRALASVPQQERAETVRRVAASGKPITAKSLKRTRTINAETGAPEQELCPHCKRPL